MNAVAEGLKFGKHYDLPEQEVMNLLKVSTGDSWVVRNWSNVTLPFNVLSATQLFNSMGKHKPKAK